MGVNPLGRNWGTLVNWDSLGKFYASFAIAWTIILGAGMVWLVVHRNLSFLKIRNIPLVITATSFLHIYLVKILLAYTTNGHFLCSVEFWIMSIYLPFGIALFQANMAQLQSISDQQQKLLEKQRALNRAVSVRGQTWIRRTWLRWRAFSVVRKTEILIGIGMALQLIVTLIIYFESRKLQGYWPAELSHAKGQALCRRGWEWIPSSIWQLFWSWCYGPWLLYKIRNIKDVHYWRIQITLCVISGLLGSPMWLAALYSLKFKWVNRFWVPPMWLAPGIIVMQAVTIFFPIFEAYKSRAQLRTTLQIIKSWEENKQFDDSTLDSGSTSRRSTQKSRTSTISSGRRREMYTMAALEKALAVNPIPLLHFAATKDFTGENIIFLIQIREWRAAWTTAPRISGVISAEAKTRLFNAGVEIYTASVHDKTAEFPVNIESPVRTALDDVFCSAIPDNKQTRSTDVVNPFASEQEVPFEPPKLIRGVLEREYSSDSATSTLWDDKRTGAAEKAVFQSNPSVRPFGRTQGVIKEGFDEGVFDAAEKSIKYLVLTNTWQKFVDSHREGGGGLLAP